MKTTPYGFKNLATLNAIDRAVVSVEAVRSIISLYEHSRNCEVVSDEGMTSLFSMIDSQLDAVGQVLIEISLEARLRAYGLMAEGEVIS